MCATNICARAHGHTHATPRTPTHAHTHTGTHAHKHTWTRAHKHTRAHTHNFVLVCRQRRQIDGSACSTLCVHWANQPIWAKHVLIFHLCSLRHWIQRPLQEHWSHHRHACACCLKVDLRNVPGVVCLSARQQKPKQNKHTPKKIEEEEEQKGWF